MKKKKRRQKKFKYAIIESTKPPAMLGRMV